MVKKRVFCVVSGQVQGVFFRKFVKDCAIRIGIKGIVRNNFDDGTVEATFEGDSDKVHEMIDLLWKGSRGSDVENVEIKSEEFLGDYEFFSIVG